MKTTYFITFSETKPFRMAQSHSISITLCEFAFPKSRMVPFVTSHTTQETQITDHGRTMCSPPLLGISGSMILSTSSYPKWVVYIAFLKSMLLKKAFICRIPRFRRRRNSENLIAWIRSLQLIFELLVILSGVTVETSLLQFGKTLMPVSVV